MTGYAGDANVMPSEASDSLRIGLWSRSIPA